ncbi:MAG: hypothetical protein R2706_18020 [Acidimicrobiales bacterium]
MGKQRRVRFLGSNPRQRFNAGADEPGAFGPSQRSMMVLVGLLAIAFLGVQAETRGWWRFTSTSSTKSATLVVTAVTLTVAILGIEAARQRYRVLRDAQTVNALLVTLILSTLVVAPQFANAPSSLVVDGLSIAGHALALLTVAAVFVGSPESVIGNGPVS